jgi:hypothetical protein
MSTRKLRVPISDISDWLITYAAKAAEFGLGTADTRFVYTGFLIEE